MSINEYPLACLIGFIAGTIYYLDGWAPSTVVNFEDNRRYRGLAVLVGGGILAPLLDKFVIDGDRHEFLFGYLFGCTIGWLTFFILGLFLYVAWKSTKDNTSSRFFVIGQFSYTVLEFVYLGIAENPHLTRERFQQLAIDRLKGEAKVFELKEAMKNSNPQKYLAFAKQVMNIERADLDERVSKLEELEHSLSDHKTDHEDESLEPIDRQKIIQFEQESEFIHLRKSIMLLIRYYLLQHNIKSRNGMIDEREYS